MKLWILSAALAACAAFGQQASGKYAFEVASIKVPDPSDPSQLRMTIASDPGMVQYNNLALRDLIRIAYDVKIYQVEGPDWIDTTRFNVDAKLPAGVSDSHVPEMLQTMLAERFGLVVHRETKDHAVLALIAAKGGAKLKAAENPIPESAGGARRGGGLRVQVDDQGAHIQATSATMGSLADMVSRFSEKPIVDQSGIEGQYDFDLVLSPEALRPGRGGGMPEPTAEGAGTLYEAFGRYGLKLEPRKAPITMVVVDHMEKAPKEN